MLIPSQYRLKGLQIPMRSIMTAHSRRHLSADSKKPPSYFSEFIDSNKPQTIFSSPSTSIASDLPSSSSRLTPINHNLDGMTTPSSSKSNSSSIRDISIVISVLTVAYFAIDNYRTRLLLEQKAGEQALAHMKAIAIAQNNYNNHRKKREIQVLNERRNNQKREMKMAYHISMLRKQLIDLGVKPVDIEEAISEFEKNVKMETSISNVSGTALWVVDDSPMKAFVPNIHDYDSKK